MPSTRTLRRRIRSVKNTAQITKAMELVAASRMRKAQQNVLAARPYSQKIMEIIADLASLQTDESYRSISPLLQQRPVENVGLVFVTADRGLAGSLNTNAVRRAARFLSEESGGKPIKGIAVGRKGRDFLLRVGRPVLAEFIGLGDRPSLLDTVGISKVIIDDYINGRLDQVYLLYTEFINTVNVRPKLVKLLPIDPPTGQDATDFKNTDFIFEPGPLEVLEALLPRYIEIQIYQAILENIASEQSSRMVAMRNASDKAKELIGDLSLAYNKLRQSNITREILEIASGTVAMEGR